MAITGPRQSGKTTLARSAFADKPYVSFENPDVRWTAESDPRSFLKRHQTGAVFDEVQRLPALVSYLQQIADEEPIPGRWVPTGSRHFGSRVSVKALPVELVSCSCFPSPRTNGLATKLRFRTYCSGQACTRRCSTAISLQRS